MTKLSEELAGRLRQILAPESVSTLGVDQISAAEGAAGFTFPECYRDFLQRFNGGRSPVIRFYGLDLEHYDLLSEARAACEYIPMIAAGRYFPIACDYGGDLFCLDLHNPTGDEYPIVCWSHEAAEDPTEEDFTDLFVSFEGLLHAAIEWAETT